MNHGTASTDSYVSGQTSTVEGTDSESKGSPTSLNDGVQVPDAMRQNGLALEHAFLPLKQDRDVVLAAVQQNGLALKWAFGAPQQDRDVVLAAVQQNGLAL
jgi:hypothetical protein